MRIGMLLDKELASDPRPLNEARHLSRAGHEVHVLCYHYSEGEPKMVEGIHIHPIKISKTKAARIFGLNNTLTLFHDLWVNAISKLINEENIEVLHAHDLYMAGPALELKEKLGLPVVLDLHEYYPEAIKSYRWANRFPQRFLARPHLYKVREENYLMESDKVIVLSDEFKDHLCRLYPSLDSKKFLEYPNVPDLTQLNALNENSELNLKGRSPVLFYFGAIAARRGIFTAIAAIRVLKTIYPSISLLLAGPVDKNESSRFNRAIADEQIREHILYLGWQDMSRLAGLIKSSDICLSPILKNPQHESGVANKIFQYMYFERPLVVSDCLPQQNIVEEYKCGLVFKSDSAEDLANKVTELMSKPELMRTMGENGRKAVEDKFNLEHFGERLSAMYSEISTAYPT